jgi:hypothetical protein
VLAIVCGYNAAQPHDWSARISGIPGKLVRRLTWLGTRRSIAWYRDYFANPRDTAYLLGVLGQALMTGSPATVDLALCGAPGLPAEQVPDWVGSVSALEADSPMPGLAVYDTVVIAYPDPLGFGWGGLERRLRDAGASNIIVINGRRQVFTLTPETRSSLVRRRLFANCRLVELFFALAVVPVAACLALKDRLHGHD